MSRTSISVTLAGLLIVAVPDMVAVAAAALVAGAVWLYGELSDLRRGQ
jgi:hypothetical protein